MRQIAPGVHVLERDLRFFGIPMGARMTVLELEGGLLVHSPVDVDPSTLEALGEPRWAVAPNKFHHLYVKRFADAGVESWCAPGLVAKRPDVAFAGELDGTSPFGDEVTVVPLKCFPLTNEVVLLHHPSRTLVLTDLVFNIDANAPWLTRTAMWCACGYPGCRTTTLERVAMKRPIAREEIGGLLELDFDRVVMAHGNVIDTGGKDALAGAFAWLGL
ncbi:MAG: hypothetical protein R3F61_37640 [Myxococcota bacterium]